VNFFLEKLSGGKGVPKSNDSERGGDPGKKCTGQKELSHTCHILEITHSAELFCTTMSMKSVISFVLVGVIGQYCFLEGRAVVLSALAHLDAHWHTLTHLRLFCACVLSLSNTPGKKLSTWARLASGRAWHPGAAGGAKEKQQSN
jgi:hypothetical protein